jgi:UDP-N-acetylglucosamine--N-acetylmuramyl-(pentapeptide) pyrophosphoryl-undecaprenol N-acetylglucosamine transferase
MKKKFIISGGGTGGHIFPAIAIAKELQRQFADAEFLFVGAQGKIEMKKVPEAGFEIEGLWISGLQRKLSLDNLAFPFKLIDSLWKARGILKKFKPDIVIGVGGFASGPTLWMANMLHIPTLIQEQNSYPGITNRALAKKVQKICVAYDTLEKFFPKEKIVMTGNPVRQEVIQIKGKREKAAVFFNLDASQKTLLFVGGSLGALAINETLNSQVQKLLDRGLQVIWQTGEYYYEKAQATARSLANNRLVVRAFIREMDLAYAMSDLIVSRAGAIAISEISAIGKPAIFVPLPTAAEDHQRLNAMALVNKNAAEIVLNKDTGEKLIDTVIALINDETKQAMFSQNILKMAITDADQRIVKVISNIINR